MGRRSICLPNICLCGWFSMFSGGIVCGVLVEQGEDEMTNWTARTERPIERIAAPMNLALSEQSSEEERAMELSESLEDKSFLLILDDCWETIELENLGASHVCRGRGEKWKVVLSTRNDSRARTMKNYGK
eukprot:Gb_37796 [translate_table: standard]